MNEPTYLNKPFKTNLIWKIEKGPADLSKSHLNKVAHYDSKGGRMHSLLTDASLPAPPWLSSPVQGVKRAPGDERVCSPYTSRRWPGRARQEMLARAFPQRSLTP